MPAIRITDDSSQVPINIVGGSSYGRFNKISSEKTQNMFISTAGTPGSEDQEAWLIGFPGYRRVLNIIPYPSPAPTNTTPNELPSGSGRALFNSIRGNFLIIVVNATVYRLNSDFQLITIGTLSSPTGEVFIAENLNQQICLVDGIHAYIYDYSLAGPNLTIQTDGALGSGALIPNTVRYHNTFFVFGNALNTASGSAWYVYSFSSNAAVANAITQTSQLALQTKADYAIAVWPLPGQGNNVIVFGTSVCEIWTQVGGLLNYQRTPSKNINYGCASVSTIADSGEIITWLGVNEDEAPAIMAYSGNNLERISTDGIDFTLRQIKYPAQSTAMMYRTAGHLLYQITFYNQHDNLTLVYDFNTKLFFNLTDQYTNYHPARYMAYFNLNTYFVSLNNAALYQLSSSFYNIDENIYNTNGVATNFDSDLVYPIPMMRITSSVRHENSTRFRPTSFVMTLEQGTDENYVGATDVTNFYMITENAFSSPDDPIITETGVNIIIDDPEHPNYNPDVPYIPHIDLSVSRDGGITWSSNVRRNLHYLGHRQNILMWEGMGVANDLTIRMEPWGIGRWIINNGLLSVVIE